MVFKIKRTGVKNAVLDLLNCYDRFWRYSQSDVAGAYLELIATDGTAGGEDDTLTVFGLPGDQF